MQNEDSHPASLRVLTRSDATQFISEVGERLFSTLDLRETMQNIVECFVPAACEFCVLFQYDGRSDRKYDQPGRGRFLYERGSGGDRRSVSRSGVEAAL
jgi:hypothetical protein